MTKEGFSSSQFFQSVTIQKQYNQFHGLFLEGTQAREEYRRHLSILSDVLVSNSKSTDDDQGPDMSLL